MTEDRELVKRAQAGEVAANKGNKWYLENYYYAYKKDIAAIEACSIE